MIYTYSTRYRVSRSRIATLHRCGQASIHYKWIQRGACYDLIYHQNRQKNSFLWALAVKQTGVN